MKIQNFLIIPILFTLLVGCSSNPKNSADSIYFGGDILTMDGDKPSYVEAVAVSKGKIVFTGSKKLAFAMKNKSTKLRDLAGNTLLPGFIDPHGHFMAALAMVDQVNLSSPPAGTVTDIPSIIAKLQEFQKQRQVAEGEWIIGWGYDQDQLLEQRHITKADIDAYFPNHKVMLIHVSMHGVVLNSKALLWAGVNAETSTPAGGVIARMEGSNEPAGLLMEMAYLPIYKKMPRASESQRLESMKAAQMLYAKEGYTHINEGFTNLADLDFLIRAANEDKIFLDINSLPSFADAAKWMGNANYKFGEYNKGLKLQGIKFTQDGSPQAKTAHFSTPYLTGGLTGEKDWYGETTQPKANFIKQVKTAFDAGLQVFIHANGDATIDQAIEAVEAAGITAKDDRRTVIVHSQFQRPDQLDKYQQLGISPSYFTNHTFYWGDVHIKNVGLERASFISPIKAAADKGIPYSIHTDFYVTPLDPFFIIWTAMKRQTRAGVILGADQRVDAYAALKGFTTGAAWQFFEENRTGKIKQGLLANFAIVSANPVKTPVDQIRDIEVIETIKEDKTVYLAAHQVK